VEEERCEGRKLADLHYLRAGDTKHGKPILLSLDPFANDTGHRVPGDAPGNSHFIKLQNDRYPKSEVLHMSMDEMPKDVKTKLTYQAPELIELSRLDTGLGAPCFPYGSRPAGTNCTNGATATGHWCSSGAIASFRCGPTGAHVT
jgi:hypothetical protein